MLQASRSRGGGPPWRTPEQLAHAFLDIGANPEQPAGEAAGGRTALLIAEQGGAGAVGLSQMLRRTAAVRQLLRDPNGGGRRQRAGRPGSAPPARPGLARPGVMSTEELEVGLYITS